MKLFEELYFELMNWYELAGFSYFLLTSCISFSPGIILIIFLFVKGIHKLRKKKYFKQILKPVQAILKKIRRRDLCSAQTCEKKAVSTLSLF